MRNSLNQSLHLLILMQDALETHFGKGVSAL